MYFLETEVTNGKDRKNYKCNEETDYFNRAGHNCYDDNSNVITTILIGIVLIVLIYLLGYLLPKKIKKHRNEKKEKEKNQLGENITENNTK